MRNVSHSIVALVCSFCQALPCLAQAAATVDKPYIVAHRGGRTWAPENTMAAFRKALAEGVEGIELDIHRCKSGELVVIHDETVNRTSDLHTLAGTRGGAGLVKDMTYDELRKLSNGAWFGAAFKDERIPLLSDVLKLIDGRCDLNIEIKNTPVEYPGIDKDLIGLLQSYKYPDRIIISSFDHEILRRIHKEAPQYRLALNVDAIIVDLGSYAKTVGAKNWHPAFDGIRADNVKAAHDAGLEVEVWTVNKPSDWEKAIDMGVDAIITDDPKGLHKFLHDRGEHK